MRFIRQFIAAQFLLLTAGAALAASGLPPLPPQAPIIRSWGTEAGLPQNSVNALVQTREGYLWAGTQDGLARFDGMRFKLFSLQDGLPSVNISSLLQGHDGSLWIGTADAGVSRLYHGRIELIASAETQPGSDTITCLAEDGGGRLWVGTGGGLRCCRNGRLEGDSRFGNLRHAAIIGLMRSRDGKTLWIASRNYGLFSYCEGKLEPCPGPPEHEKISGESLLEDTQGRFWVGIGNGMVLCRQHDEWQVYNETNGLPFAFVTSMVEDAEGTVWAGSLDAGLYRFDGANFHLVSQKDGLSAEDIRSLACDREGNLWIGTRTGGLNRLSRRRLTVVSAAQGLANDFTHSVAQTPDGTLWVGTTGGSLYRGDPTGFRPFRPADPRVYYYATVFPVLGESDGSLWWGAAYGLLHWQNDRLVDCITNAPWIQNATVTALQRDPQGGLWIGTSAGHLVRLRAGQLQEFPQQITRATISSLAVATNGALWVGTLASGLKYIPPKGDTVLTITNGLTARSSICALHLDEAGDLWIGTAGDAQGLSCLRNGRLTRFAAAEGIPPLTVLQIVEDDHGILWLGCRRGIYRISKADLLARAKGDPAFIQTRSFGLNDGMLTEECSGGFSPAGLKMANGLICISTVKGLVFLNPNQLNDELPPPRVLLEETRVHGVEQPLLEDTTAAHTPASGPAPQGWIKLAPGPRDLELHYTAIGFSAPEKIGFRYRLEPLDADWKDAGPQRTFIYPHLPPGEFQFHVQACNADGRWSRQDTILAITALPFFWETSWCHAAEGLLLSGLLAGSLWLVLRRRYRHRLARLQALNAIERERLRISKDMHDLVGSVLTQVSQLTDMGLNETGDQAMVKKRFERIGNRSRLAVQALDEIVWATNPKNDNLASFAEYVSRFSDEFFEYTDIRCWQEVPATLPAVPLQADVRHNVFLAVREALNNALKHAHCHEVWLKMKVDEGRVTLSIEDNGRGFTPAQTAPGGNGLGNMEARLADCGGRAILQSTPGKGTRIRFIFPVQ